MIFLSRATEILVVGEAFSNQLRIAKVAINAKIARIWREVHSGGCSDDAIFIRFYPDLFKCKASRISMSNASGLNAEC
jgi:hypothetical protein